ncbi:MAG: N-acetylneuraminate synthase [Flavobacteriales bacterium]|nr:N-acetylneuraminate synthase [Flavobacteriales bacterium]
MAVHKTIIIAEAGVNHNGDLALAKKLIDVAAEAEVDYVKFQTFVAEKNIASHAEKASYQVKNTQKPEESQLDMVSKLELSEEDHIELQKYCLDRNVKFSSTAFDFESIDLLERLGMDFFKIPSGEITNLPYLQAAAGLNKPIIMSTGMANIHEIEDALSILRAEGLHQDDITVLHCNTEYPTPMEDVNLNAMNTIAKELNVSIGYSDHTLGIEVPIAAVALGAKVIEKHFTLDRKLPGPDHRASLEPHELVAMVAGIRNIEKALGTGVKEPSESEKKNIGIARKSIVASCDIRKGDLFTEKNLTTKRPGTGSSPMKWYEIIGKKAIKDYKADELI